MSLEENSGNGIPATMLVGPATFGNAPSAYPYPVYGMGGGNSSGLGNGWGDGAWIILLIIVLLAAGGGWGNNTNSGSGFGSGQPIVINEGGTSGGYAVQRGFDQAAIMSGITGVQSGVQGLATQLCGCCGDMQMSLANGFAGVQQSLCNGFAGTTAAVTGVQNAITQQMYTNQIADMERSFAAQTANTQGMTGLQAQLAQCCCDNRLATESLRATVLQENCQDRYEAQNNTRDIIDSQTRSTQAILDKLCALELDGVKGQLAQAQRENVALQNQINMANMQIGFNNETDALYNRLKNCPIPSTPVYGTTPIFSCNNGGCCGAA